MKKRAFAAFLAVILLLGLSPSTALAAGSKVDITSTGLAINNSADAAQKAGDYTTTGGGTVKVEYDSTSTPAVVTITMNGATMTRGISVTDLDVQLNLSGTNSIQVENNLAVSVGNGTLTICGNGSLATAAEKTDFDSNYVYTAIYSSGGIVVDGSTVQADSDSSNGFYTNSSIQLKNGATISGECGYPLLYAASDIQISGSTVNADVWGDFGIWSAGTLTISDSSTVDAKGYGAIGAVGDISIADSTVTAYSDGSVGLLARSTLTISGENTVVNATSEAATYDGVDSEGKPAVYSYPGIAGWGNIAITGGKVTASALDAQGIQGLGNLEISGATTEVNISNTSDNFFALTVDGNITITGGTTTVSSTGNEGIYPHGELKLSGGSLSVTSQGHGLYMPDSALNVSGGNLSVVSQGEDPGIRSGRMEISGGTVTVDCPNADHPIALNDSDNGLTYTGGTLNLPNVGPEGGISTNNTVYFLVLFDFENGEERKSELIKQGEKIIIDDPERTNFIFKGWYDAPSGGNEWNLESNTVTANMLLYAQWTPLHQHIWSDEWTSSQTHHWHTCLGEDCYFVSDSQNKDYASHTPGGAATCTAPQTCTVCGYEFAAALGHSLGGWQSDAAAHWKTCSVCGEKAGNAAHIPGEWVIDREATSTAPGQRHKECTVCGYITETEALPVTGGGSSGDDSSGDDIFSDDSSGSGSSTPTYKPEVTQPGGGGSVSVSANDPKRGDPVIITPKPDAGYEVDTVTVTDQNGNPVVVKKNLDGTYTFTQPNSRVKIEVTYRPVQPTQPVDSPWRSPFSDVSDRDWFYEAVRFVQERGLMNGYSDGRFGPNDNLSRAQLAQILFNKEGRPVVNYLPGFSDVPDEAWYAGAIRWAASQGIVGGYGNGLFGPNGPITREQLAVMLWRYSGSPAAAKGDLRFDDVGEISGFALEAMGWAVENGILNGFGDGRLGPQGQATRAQAAQMLKNFLENQEGYK